MFMSKLTDADGEAAETQAWLDFARDCKYLDPNQQVKLQQRYEE